MGVWIVLGVIAALAFWAISVYNRLVALRNRFKNAFAQIDVQLKRRYDLIPNRIEAAKGYLAHERQTLEAVIAARGAAMGADPATSAVNKYLQSWDVSNVFAIGGSAFPQNSAYAPTGTIGTLACWAADNIKETYLKKPGAMV